MGIKLGDISPLAGAISGKGMFGKGLAKLADSGVGMLVPMSYLAKSQRDKAERKAAGRPVVGGAGDVDAMMSRSAQRDMSGMKKGGKISAAEAVHKHKHERAKHKGQPLTKMAKGGSTASKRGDGCAIKGKTKGRFV